MKNSNIILSLVAVMLAASCSTESEQATKSGLLPSDFNAEYRGEATSLYTLTNDNGAEACITNFGGRLVSLLVPDRNGKFLDVVLGFDSIEAYYPENNLSDFGASIGRYANRINQGRFVLDGDTIRLPQNNGPHCLHGGGEYGDLGWQYRVYKAEQQNDSSLLLTIESPDGDNGFPGNMTATVCYTLHNNNSLQICYTAVTDKPTVVNLTNHSYFNLNGDGEKAITDNILWVNASAYTPIDSTFMTTGEIASVEGTSFDFRREHAIGDFIRNFEEEQVKNGNGYDHNFVLDTNGDITVPALRIYSPETGIVMEAFTNEPGVQVYSGNFLDGTVTGKYGKSYKQHAAICFESQHYPDTPNKEAWPSVRLNPGETYTSKCIYRFSVK